MGVIQQVRTTRVFSQNWQEQNRVLNFSWRFRQFPENKSRKQNTETEQARPQLCFAPKIIKIHLVVSENELIEVCMLVSKSVQKNTQCGTPSCMVMCIESLVKDLWMNNTPEYTCMKVWPTRDSFWYFLGTSKQTSINSFSKTNKWILMIFEAKQSWGLACSVSVFCFLLLFSGNQRNLQEKFRSAFFPC